MCPLARRATRNHTPYGRAGVLAALAVLAIGLLVLGAAPARAGGPTSVLVVNYDGTRATAALTGSQTYEDLATALDIFSGEPPSGKDSAPADFMGTQLRLTWLVHDVVPWRLDALRLDGEQIWVNTVVSWDGDLFGHPGVWHRPADEALLRATLTSLGALGPAPSASLATRSDAGGAGLPPAASAAPVQLAHEAIRPEATGAPDARPGWALATAGLVGLLLGWSGHRFARGRACRHRDDALESGDPGVPTTRLDEPSEPGTPPAPRDDGPVSRFTLR